MTRATATADFPAATREAGAVARALLETTKPRITRLVTLTAAIGLGLAALERGGWSAGPLAALALWTVLGTALSSSGANALNQWWERERDARMRRTSTRPLPTGRLEPATVLVQGLVLSILGVGVLWAGAGPVPAAVSAATILLYVLVYTPMKARSVWCTVVGSVPGALPPVIGWTAGMGGHDASAVWQPGALALFALMAVWQLPHFYAIAWMYREDYAAGAYRVLPVLDQTGRRTAGWTVATAALLVGAAAWPAVAIGSSVGWPYLAVALVTSLAYLWLTVRFARERSRPRARAVFFGSIAHLPLLLITLVAEASLRAVA